MKRALAVAVLLWSTLPSVGLAQKASGLPLSGEAAEAFLKTAQLVRKKSLSVGVTHSQQYTLTDGTRTCRAVWKTIDEFKRGISSFEGGGVIVDFADSWKHEVAAYDLDKLIGLGLVPPTVEREFAHTRGSLQLWVEGAMTESDRKERKLSPPDPRAWNEQMYKVRLLHQLTFNTDYRNIRNVLLDASFRVYAVDSSRAFQVYTDLMREGELLRFPRAALEAMKALDKATLHEKLGRWLDGPRIDTLLKRRDRILALAARRVEEQGEAAVLF
jgi:hypothetical protein